MIRLAAILAVITGPALAVEFIETRGKLSDEEFYNLVTCAAPPGRPCAEQVVRWPDRNVRDLRVVLEPIHPAYPKSRAKEMLAALDRAIAELNAAGAGLHLRRVPTGHGAPMRIYLTPAGDGDAIFGTGVDGVDDEIIGAGLTTVWWNDNREITNALIVMAGDLPSPEIYPVMLEELTQALGFLTDIRSALYERESVFSEDSNSVTRLGPQDLMVLRRHYP